MIFLDLLDSAKSAHVKEYVSEWWRPENDEQQRTITEMAQAEMMVRILYGETITLSNNQATDSVAWLTNAEKFCSLDTPWEPVAVAFSGVQPSSPADAIRDILINYFADHSFKLSSWVGLEDKLKDKVAENLKQHDLPNFEKMFIGVIDSMFDQKLSDKLNQQAFGLQKFYEYLNINQAKPVSIRAVSVGDRLWPRLMSLKDDPKGIPAATLDSIKDIATPHKVEFRGSLYNALEKLDMDSHERIRIRKFIDRYYNEKMGLSVANGKGVYTTTDFDLNTSLDEDESIDIRADQYNGEDGLLGRVALEINPETSANFLKWDDFASVLKDDVFRKSARGLRLKIEEYDDLKPMDPWYDRKYRLWHSQTYEILNQHHELLASYLGKRIIHKGSSIKIYIAPAITAAVPPLLALAAGNNLGEQVIYTFLGGLVGYAASEIVKEKIQPVIKTANTTGCIRTALKDSVKLKSLKELHK